MTSEKTMLSWTTFVQTTLVALLCISTLSCGPKIVTPDSFANPYPTRKVWAITPLLNETGTSLADGVRFADHLVNQFEQIEGITVLPLNRVLAAMSANGIENVTSIGETIMMINVLKVDGLIVGTLTNWDPYEPPKIGAKIQLFSREKSVDGSIIDSRLLTYAATGDLPSGTSIYSKPVAQVSMYMDAASGDILTKIAEYAKGRIAIDSPGGWRRYLLSMDLYCEFVCHELAGKLLDEELSRLTGDQNQFKNANTTQDDKQ